MAAKPTAPREGAELEQQRTSLPRGSGGRRGPRARGGARTLPQPGAHKDGEAMPNGLTRWRRKGAGQKETPIEHNSAFFHDTPLNGAEYGNNEHYVQ